MEGGENTYGGCESLNAVHTKLKPSGGHGFIINRKSRHTLISWKIKDMLSGPGQFVENEVSEVDLESLSHLLLRDACILPTRSATLIAPLRFLNSQLHLNCHWSF